MKLILPLPPSRNAQSKQWRRAHGQKRRYQKACWAAAVQQVRPTLDPPESVVLSAHFRLYGPLRDEDGLDLKWVLDALRQTQTGDVAWRQGLFDECGYFVDDDPARLSIGSVTQEIDRKNMRLEITLESAA